jgi:NAD(P)-dependent dehydrogenase (short-subunit alcohol dehydrogenase family)
MKVLITGVSRGIGLELARVALRAGHQVLAVARQPQASAALVELARGHAGQLQVMGADLRGAGSAAAIAAAVQDRGLDVLLNNAGILLEGETREDFIESFMVNSVAPFEVTHALLPQLRKSANARVVHVTSKMGSIADNTAGGHYAYRASKAALNMVNRSIARDHDWLTAVVVHPGWVRTRMGGAEAPVQPEESARGIWNLVENLDRKSSGRFFDFQGRELPW